MDAIAVAAVSARMMAQSAQRGGFVTSAIDVFGDVDTRAASDEWWSAGDAASLRIDKEHLVRALERFAPRKNAIGWVAGGGFEASLDALAVGAQVAPLIGNAPATFATLRTPREFFGRLSALGIPYPEIAWELPPDPARWLVKDAGSSGGWHVRAATDEDEAIEPGSRRYFQRIHAGAPMSALFVANGRASRIVGVNEMIVERHDALPYVYHGAIASIALPARTLEHLQAHVDAMVREWQLVGVNGVDFLLDGESIAVLEINPRPTATLALHEHATPRGLIHAHVHACLGRELPHLKAIDHTVMRGHVIVFAETTVTMTPALCNRMAALGFVHDIPCVGTSSSAGAPLCSVSAHGESDVDVRTRLAAASASVLRLMRSAHDVFESPARRFVGTEAS